VKFTPFRRIKQDFSEEEDEQLAREALEEHLSEKNDDEDTVDE